MILTNSLSVKLRIKKELITKLNATQMKKFIGGLAQQQNIGPKTGSCKNDTCNSNGNTASCDDYSCECVAKAL